MTLLKRLCTVVFLGSAPMLAADITITLKDTFIDKFKNRALIEDTCQIVKAHKKPNPVGAGSKDGDLHIASLCKVSQLQTVAEIMNAKNMQAAVDLVHAKEGTSESIPVTGVWRLWCEHGGSGVVHTQGGTLEPITDTNPDHVFEIHPITSIGGTNVIESLGIIDGFTEKDAQQAFMTYERTRCHISHKGKTTTIRTTMAGFNYVKFRINLNEKPLAIADGLHFFAQVLEVGDDNEDGEILVRNRRMVVPAGSKAAEALKGGKKGDSFVVLGLPRINLSLVQFRASHLKDRPELADWDLPYEMVILGVFP